MEATSSTASRHRVLSRSTPPESTRIALVHDWLTGMRGGEKCLEILCQSFPDATLHTLLYRRGSLSAPIESMAIRTSALQHFPGVIQHYRKLLPLMPLAARGWKPGKVDVVLSFSHCVAKSVRVPAGVPHLCYCFTPMRYAWDGRDAYLGTWKDRPFQRALASLTLDRLRAWDQATSKGVTRFIAISETVRQRIADCYGRDSVVIRPPVDTSFYTMAPTLPRDGPFLCVSALVPYKKIDHAVIACTADSRPLVVIGTGPEQARLQRLAGPTVTFLGWQPNEVLREHYRRCRALLFPGLEDFGIVPAEALACGAPVIALNRGGVAETVDDSVGRLYNEASAEGLRAALSAFELEHHRFDPNVARRRVEPLSMEQYRQRMLNMIEEVRANRHSPGIPRPHLFRRREPSL